MAACQLLLWSPTSFLTSWLRVLRVCIRYFSILLLLYIPFCKIYNFLSKSDLRIFLKKKMMKKFPTDFIIIIVVEKEKPHVYVR